MYARRPISPFQCRDLEPLLRPATPTSSAYADPASCASCHAEIARTYSLTGMARSFSRCPVGYGSRLPRLSQALPIATTRWRSATASSTRDATRSASTERKPMQSSSKPITSSAPAITREPSFTATRKDLIEMPVSWYAEEQVVIWAMSPGTTAGASRLPARHRCGLHVCHNGYPRAPVRTSSTARNSPTAAPEGIDCQRCHGPGQAHIDAVKARRPRSGPSCDRESRETRPRTTSRNVHAMSSRVDEQSAAVSDSPIRTVAVFLLPGKPLGDYFIYFDHAPGTRPRRQVRDRRRAYRLRKSACFQRSQMTCVTCHNPHDIPRGAKAVQALRCGLPELSRSRIARRAARRGCQQRAPRASTVTCRSGARKMPCTWS